ncbi:MAG: NAD-dependent epimerase/dehydratase family protein [Bacteroidetes bacterium]|nr:NAD-dependent epimerase/dehydratase family protein [Bacteroidota bacterium]
MKKIFITGASGFVGGAIAKRLAPDHWVLAMARSAQAFEKVKALGVRPVSCGLDTIEAGALQEFDTVIHCAAYVEPWGKFKDFYEVNVEGTRRLLEAARKAGVKRFIHIGTEAALFKGQDMMDIDESYPYPDHSPYPYSETKKQAEQLVLRANVPGEFETISIRPRLVWGPGDETILPNLLEMIDKGRFRWIDGGNYLTSTCYIDNLVDAVVMALDKGNGGEAYFVTDATDSTMREFLTDLVGTAGRKPSNQSVPSWILRPVAWIFEAIYKLFRIRKKPPVTRFSAAIMSAHCTIRSDKAREELGYIPNVSVEEGMRRLKEKK